LLGCLQAALGEDRVAAPGLAALLKLQKGTPDLAIAREASMFGMSLTPLSAWYAPADEAESGLLLGVATAPITNLARSCDRLLEIIRRFADQRQG